MPILQLKPQWELGNLPDTAETDLAGSEFGNYQTVQIMQNAARARCKHPKVRGLALKILEQKGIASHNYLDEARAIAEFVQTNVRYVRDIDNVEQLHDPLYMIDRLIAGTAQGDCDDMSLLLASLLLSVGCQPLFAIVRYRSTCGPFNHIYVVCYEKNWTSPRKRLVMDTILKDRAIGAEVPHTSREEIRV